MQAATIGMFDEVDRQLAGLARVALMPRSPPPPTAAPTAEVLPFVAAPPAIAAAVPGPIPRLSPLPQSGPARPRTAIIVTAVLVAVLGLGIIAAVNILHLLGGREPLTGKAAIDAAVTRIIAAESRGAVEPKNKRSSAAGPAQFLDDTWLELIRAARPDLMKGRSRDQLLELRSKPGLAREIAMRFAERNAALLKRRGLPVTAGTLYLAHFAGPAGAAALLSAPADADAAAVMAKADATGEATREQIVKANPFLDRFTAADIRRWADRKMDGPTLVLTELLSAATKK
jgi:hypothetical protein